MSRSTMTLYSNCVLSQSLHVGEDENVDISSLAEQKRISLCCDYLLVSSPRFYRLTQLVRGPQWVHCIVAHLTCFLVVDPAEDGRVRGCFPWNGAVGG